MHGGGAARVPDSALPCRDSQGCQGCQSTQTPSHAAPVPLVLAIVRSAGSRLDQSHPMQGLGWGPLFPGGSWDLEIQELWEWGRTAASEVVCPGFWS